MMLSSASRTPCFAAASPALRGGASRDEEEGAPRPPRGPDVLTHTGFTHTNHRHLLCTTPLLLLSSVPYREQIEVSTIAAFLADTFSTTIGAAKGYPRIKVEVRSNIRVHRYTAF